MYSPLESEIVVCIDVHALGKKDILASRKMCLPLERKMYLVREKKIYLPL